MNTPKNIMLIEDDDDDGLAIVNAFQACNCAYSLQWLKDSSSALDYLAGDKVELPCLILLDLSLPGIDGRSILKKIKSDDNLKAIPVIIFTTSTDKKDIQYCYKNGASSYIQKPANFNRFKEICKSISTYWFDTCSLPA